VNIRRLYHPVLAQPSLFVTTSSPSLALTNYPIQCAGPSKWVYPGNIKPRKWRWSHTSL